VSVAYASGSDIHSAGETTGGTFRRRLGQHRQHFLAHHLAGFVRVLDPAQPPAVADRADDAIDVRHAHVRLEQLLFDLAEELIVDLPPGNEERPDVGIQHRRGLPQGAFELVEGF
jgi:hypothetical protein